MKLARLIVASIAAAAAMAVATPASADAFTIDGKRCDLIEVPAAATPLGTGSCEGVRPGALVETDAGLCTLNFLFTGTDGQRYIGTAGHCILGEGPIGADVGEETWAAGEGPDAFDSEGNRIGEFAYAVLEDPKDFALIRLDPGVEASPQMCHFGGPTGVNADETSAPQVLHHYGNGDVVSAVLPARSVLALSMPDPDDVLATGVVVPGDSGSGIVSADGRAVGVVVALGVGLRGIGTEGVEAGPVIVTRLAPQERRAEQQLGTTLTLVPAPTL